MSRKDESRALSRQLAEDQRNQFLVRLAQTGSVSRAASAMGIDASTPHAWARKDEEFAKLMEEAKTQGEKVQLGRLEDEIDRRAVDGWDEPVYQGGREVGKVRRYSDSLLALRVKRLDPLYRERPPDNIVNAGAVQIVVGSFTGIPPSTPPPQLPPPALDVGSTPALDVGSTPGDPAI